MSDKRPAVFLERRTYRARRLADAIRLLPILSVGLFCLPLLWALSGEGSLRTTTAMSFIFVTWVALIGVTALVSSRLNVDIDDAADGNERDE